MDVAVVVDVAVAYDRNHVSGCERELRHGARSWTRRSQWTLSPGGGSPGRRRSGPQTCSLILLMLPEVSEGNGTLLSANTYFNDRNTHSLSHTLKCSHTSTRLKAPSRTHTHSNSLEWKHTKSSSFPLTNKPTWTQNLDTAQANPTSAKIYEKND